jgi:uncharacterized protein (DUF58 family)
MPPLEHGFIRRLDDRYRGWFTPAGRALLWGLVAAGILRLGTISPALFVTLGAFAGLLAAAALSAAPFRPRVALRRRLPPPPSAGDTWSYEVLVENTGRRTLRDLVIEERGLPADLRPAGEGAVIEALAPGEEARVRLKLLCKRRGVFALGTLQAASSFPAGLVKVGRRAAVPDRLLVYPAFERLRGFDVPASKAYQPGGIPVASEVGESMEFRGLREWRDGDRPRDVHWPAYARTGRLVVREFQEEHFVRLALVLDVAAPGVRDEPIFERALSVAAAVADALARKEYIIDIFAAGESVHHFQAGRALAHFENILELLACLEPGETLDVGALSAVIVPEAPRLSAVIFVVTGWDEGRASIVGLMKSLGVRVRVINARPDDPVEGLAPDEVVALT